MEVKLDCKQFLNKGENFESYSYFATTYASSIDALEIVDGTELLPAILILDIANRVVKRNWPPGSVQLKLRQLSFIFEILPFLMLRLLGWRFKDFSIHLLWHLLCKKFKSCFLKQEDHTVPAFLDQIYTLKAQFFFCMSVTRDCSQ